MDTLEQSTKGSEIFPMDEKTHHYGNNTKFTGVGSAAATSMLGVLGALLILLCSVVPPRGDKGNESPTTPPSKPPVVSVSPSGSPSPDPEVSESPSPDPEVSESPSPSPEPSVSPEPSEQPDTPPYRPPYVPPTSTSPSPTVSPSPTPKSEPEISFSAVFFESLDHIALNIEITANEATDLVTTINVMTNSEDSFGGSFSPNMPEIPGA